MTDAEIIKALECCNTEDENGFANCDDCPYYAKGICLTCPEIFDLINRLQTDKEALIAGQETLQKALAEKNAELESITEKFNCQQTVYADLSDIIREKNAEIERLKNDCFCISNERDAIGDCLNEAVEEAKAEAIKELMFNLDEEISTYSSAGHDLNVYAWLKNYVKEMVGETE